MDAKEVPTWIVWLVAAAWDVQVVVEGVSRISRALRTAAADGSRLAGRAARSGP